VVAIVMAIAVAIAMNKTAKFAAGQTPTHSLTIMLTGSLGTA
jgi:hypothetical protein